MKHYPIQILLLLVLCIQSTTVSSQKILWEKSCGGKHADHLMDVKATPDYGFILAGSSLSSKTGNKTESNQGDYDYWIWKMNEKGDLEWQKSFGGNNSDFLESISLTSDAGFILAGTSASNKGQDKTEDSKGQHDFWILKLDAKGRQEWQKTIGGSGQDQLQSVLQTKDGGYIVGGSSSSDRSGDKTSEGFGNLDFWIVKLDRKGTIEWQQTYGGRFVDELRSLEQTTDGGYIVGGYSNSPESGNKTENTIGIGDYWILKLNSKGGMEWQKTLGGDKDDQLYVVHQMYDGGYLIGGNSNSPIGHTKNKDNENGTDFWVLKCDLNGAVQWQATYDFGTVDILTSMVENLDHTILIGGFTQGEPTMKGNKTSTESKMKKGTDDYIALKISEKGESLWNTIVGSNGQDILKKVIETRDGGYLMTGTSNAKASRDKNSAIGQNDFWVVKLKDENKPDKVKVQIEASPNPTFGYTNIVIGYEFETGTATLVDLAGHILEKFDLNSRTVPIDLTAYPEGIYIVNITTNVQSDGVKIIKGISKN